ncbi:hypothetical protein Shyd_72980 [Streptomyces hydrogenans]|uniref:Uncharacterized protein n=2 Tax=Streptomyces hydrogenans TaxID=1873719 RepID=A0ABQ3PLQ2_9ACTN|nr:hypothetical protein Shyd_72980 [Streptomyces hydrogenans]
MGEVFSVVLLPNLRIVSNRLPYQIMRKIEGKVSFDDFMRRSGQVSDEATVQEVSRHLSRLGPVRERADRCGYRERGCGSQCRT